MISDRVLGGLIFIVCVLIMILYVVSAVFPSLVLGAIRPLGIPTPSEVAFQFWVIAIPVVIAVLVVLFIGAWIGWTMLTTPPPVLPEEIKPPEEKPPEEKPKEEKK